MELQWAERDGYEAADAGDWQFTIQPRPHYCDRGRWIAQVFYVGARIGELDAADAWPRYYFDLAFAKREISMWVENREAQRARQAPAKAAPVVHVLAGRWTLCGFGRGDVPSRWPVGNSWVRMSDARLATCPGCAMAAEKTK